MDFSQHFENRQQFFSFCNDLIEAEDTGLNIAFALTNEKLSVEEVARVAQENDLCFSFKKNAEDLYYCEFGVRKKTAEAMVICNNQYWMFVLTEETPISSVRSFVKNLSPILRICYVDSGKLVELVESVREDYNVINLREGTIVTEGETFRRWEKEPIKFSKAISQEIEKEQKGHWSNIKISLGNSGESGWIGIRLYSQGSLTIYKGPFYDILEKIINAYVKTGIDNEKYFSNKKRTVVDNEIIINPIEIKFEESLRQKQINTLKKIISNQYTSSVVFSGNPFLLMQIIDKQDGSSYDFYAYSNKIEIIPLLKATSSSLTGLYSLTMNILPTGQPQY